MPALSLSPRATWQSEPAGGMNDACRALIGGVCLTADAIILGAVAVLLLGAVIFHVVVRHRERAEEDCVAPDETDPPPYSASALWRGAGKHDELCNSAAPDGVHDDGSDLLSRSKSMTPLYHGTDGEIVLLPFSTDGTILVHGESIYILPPAYA